MLSQTAGTRVYCHQIIAENGTSDKLEGLKLRTLILSRKEAKYDP